MGLDRSPPPPTSSAPIKNPSDRPRSKSQTVEMPSDSSAICPACNVLVGTTGIQCDACDCWSHLQCEGLSRSQFGVLRSIPGLIFCCKGCDRDGLIKALREIKLVRQTCADLEAKLSRSDEDLAKFKAEINTRIAELSRPQDPSVPSDTTPSPERFDELMDERIERYQKRDYVVVVGLPESMPALPSGSLVPADRARIDQIATGIGIPPASITEVFRFGQLDPDRISKGIPRIIKVKFHAAASNLRLAFLKDAHKSISADPSLRGTWCRADLSAAQRKAAYTLRVERNRRIRDGEDVVIRRGNIVPRPAGAPRPAARPSHAAAPDDAHNLSATSQMNSPGSG